jgi:pyrroloquinoline quinone biosynthesis protein D
MRAELADNPQARLAPGFRLQWEEAQQAHVLLYPEGMVTLSDSANEILKRCDGRAVDQIIAELQQQFPGADLEADVLEFLEVARAEGWLQFR